MLPCIHMRTLQFTKLTGSFYFLNNYMNTIRSSLSIQTTEVVSEVIWLLTKEKISWFSLFWEIQNYLQKLDTQLLPVNYCLIITPSKMPSGLKLGAKSLGSTGPGRLNESVNGPGEHNCLIFILKTRDCLVIVLPPVSTPLI